MQRVIISMWQLAFSSPVQVVPLLLLLCCVGPSLARIAGTVNATTAPAPTPTQAAAAAAAAPEGNGTAATTDAAAGTRTDVPTSPSPSEIGPTSALTEPSATGPSSLPATSSPSPPSTAEPFSYEVFRHRCASEHLEGIWWNETCGGVIAARRCPPGYTGTAFRMCFYGGDWGQVDVSECRLSKLMQLKHVVYYQVHKNLTRGFHTVADDLLQLVRTFPLHSLDDVLEALDALTIMLSSHTKLDLSQPPDAHFVQSLLEIGDRLFTRQEVCWTPPHTQQVQEQVTLTMVQTLHHMGSLGMMVADGMKRAGYAAYQVDALPHLGLSARLSAGREDYVFTRKHGNDSEADRIVVPAKARRVTGESADSKYAFITLWYQGFHEKLEDPDTIVNSAILASFVHPSRSHRLNAPVTVTFWTRQSWDPSAYHVECSSLQKTSNRSNLWSSNGCTVVGAKEHEVTCKCHRVNNVAVVLRRIIRLPQKLRPEAVNTVILVGCFFSLLALMATMLAHAHLIKSDAADSTLILFHLIAAMAATQILFMAGIQATMKHEVCESVSIVLHYFHLATSFWLLSHGINVYLRLRRGPDVPVARHMRDYCLLAWAIPVILVVLTFIANPRGYETKRYCWLSIERGMLLSFIVPVSSLIMINTTLMVLALKHFFELRAITRKIDIDRIRIAMRLGVVAMPLFGVNWFVGVLALEDTSTYVFEVAFAFTNSLQGFLVFFFNCILNVEIRRGLWRRCCCFRRKQRKSLDLRLRRSRKRHADGAPLLIKLDEGLTPTLAPPMPASATKDPAPDHVAT